MGREEELTNPKLKTKLWEYNKRERTDGPYADNLEVDALVVGGGFAGVFSFWALRKEGFKVVMYEAGNDLGGTCKYSIAYGANSKILADLTNFSRAMELLS